MTPSRDQELAVLRAVIYASLFDYPLTLAQLQTNLGVRATQEMIVSWWRTSDLLQSTVDYRDGWFFPAGRADLVETRRRREAISRTLLDRDGRVLSILCAMPFVRMVALSGSLAHLNAEGSADLDVFVITAPARVWSVTFAALLATRLLGVRRRICLNFIVSERAMEITPPDLFSANQIIHLRPIAGHAIFERFVKANGFVREFYPNFELVAAPRYRPSRLRLIAETLLSAGPAQIAEHVSRAVYRWHLRRRAASWQSRDQVRLEDECLKLHTTSHRAATIKRLEDAMTVATHETRPLPLDRAWKVLAS